MDYQEYIHSKRWEQQKKKLKANSCDKCGFKYELDLHHLNYDNLGEEKTSDVSTLCRRCHRDIHYEQRKGEVSETMIRQNYQVTEREYKQHDKFVTIAG